MTGDVHFRQQLLGQRAHTLWLTGLSGAGKTTVARHLERALIARGYLCTVLDGDVLRGGLNRDLGLTAQDRTENVRRAAEVAATLNQAGLLVIAAFISPQTSDRGLAAEIIGEPRFSEVYVDASLATCAKRDPKGLYRRALLGELRGLTGVDAPYDVPTSPDVHLPTGELTVTACVDLLLDHLRARRVLLGGIRRSSRAASVAVAHGGQP